MESVPEEAGETPDLGPANAQSPELGALLDVTPVYAATSKRARQLGYLHAGSRVHRSPESFTNGDCPGGWYGVAPQGYVCADGAVSLELSHPTLRAMALGPRLSAPLPYVYARTTKVTALFEKTSAPTSGERGVELRGRLSKNTGLAVVGRWTAPDESHEPIDLGLKMNGQFVRTEDLAPAQESPFRGVELESTEAYPIAFVVRRGVHKFRLVDGTPEATDEIPYHTQLSLTGRYRSVQEQQFWALKDEQWVRQRDITLAQKRHEFPDFAQGNQKWMDLSIVTGVLTLYEGTRPIFITLASVGRDRLGEELSEAVTKRGTFKILGKHITRRKLTDVEERLHDAPWALELESGQWIYASPLHDRFGIEHTDGDIEISPQDGARIWQFATPAVPEGWHGVSVPPAEATTLVHIRK